MSTHLTLPPRLFIRFLLAAPMLAFASLNAEPAAAQTFTVEQKGRMFEPMTLNIKKGDTVHIVNNDGEVLHHAYVASPTFNFDSGEQEPGSSTDIVFDVPGTFEILCGIHPKMHLTVTVK